MLEGRLDYHRGTPAVKCAGLTDEQLRTASVPPSELSLMGLVRHMAERTDEDRDGYFHVSEADTWQEAYGTWQAEIEHARHNGTPICSASASTAPPATERQPRYARSPRTGHEIIRTGHQPRPPWCQGGCRRSRVARVHRTTTTAALLVTVAVSALSGCVTVQRPPAADPPAAPARSSAPRPDGSAEPRVVQAPAREALERVGPSSPRPAARTTAPAVSAPLAEQRRPPSAHHHGRLPSHPVPAPQRRRPPQPRGEVPGGARPAPRTTDVCALGRQYGGWKADSPAARICGQAYGR